MQYDQYIPANLETLFLNIRTDSSMGSGEKVVLWFRDEESEIAAGFVILFSSDGTVQYKLLYCQKSYTNFKTSLPEEQRKEWIIEKRGFRTKVYCNGKQVLDVTASSETCGNPKYGDNWDTYWGRNASKLTFPSAHDTASDSFYIGW